MNKIIKGILITVLLSVFLAGIWKCESNNYSDVIFEVKFDNADLSETSMVLYWDEGEEIVGENFLSNPIEDNYCELRIPAEYVKKSIGYRFDPINIEENCSIREIRMNGKKLSNEKFIQAIIAMGQVEIQHNGEGAIHLSVSGNDAQIYLNEEFANEVRKASTPSIISIVFIWGIFLAIVCTWCFLGKRMGLIWLVISSVVYYVIGGNERIYFWTTEQISHKIILSYVALIIGGIIVFIGRKWFKWNQKVESFSWKLYIDNVHRIYHLNLVDCILGISFAIFGGIIRIIGYNWGIVTTFQADECKLVDPAMEMARNHTLYQRSSFYYPDQFTSKFASVFIALYSKVTGTAIEAGTMVEAYFLFRIVIVICGTLTIVTAFLIGNYLEKHLGVILAGLVSVFPVYVNLSKQVTGDVTALFFLSLTALFALRYMEEKKNVFLVLMSMGAAMATLEKWHGAVGIGFIGFVVLLNSRKVKELFCKGIYALAAYFAWLVILAPNMMFHLKDAIVDGFINIAVYDDSEGQPFGIMLQNYGKFGVEHIGGLLYLIALLLGLIYIFLHFKKQYMILLLGVIKTIILCFLNRQFVRWGLELYFIELIVASIGILWVIKQKKIYLKAVGIALCCIVAMDFASGALLDVAVAANTQNDTRMVQRRDCEAMGATVENTVSAAYTGYVSGGWCDKVYGDEGALYVFWGEYFEQVDNVMYRKKDGMDYVVMNVEMEGTSWVNRLKEFCPNYWEYNAICEDNLDEPIQSTKVTLNDINLISQNLNLTKQILGGEMSGRNIIVFDVRNLPYLTEE